MDTEPNISNQSPAKEAGVLKETPEQIFRRTIETSRQAITALAEIAIANGIEEQKLAHLGNIFTQDSHILMPPVAVMRAELAKITGRETDITKRTRALRSQKTGQVFVPEEQAGSIHDVLHESIHRATWLHDRVQGLSENQTLLANQLASKYGVTISKDGKIDPDSEYIRTYASNDNERTMLIEFFMQTLKERVPQATEGLTEWATKRANGLTTKEGNKITMMEDDLAYQELVKEIEEIKTKMIKQKGITNEKADAILITAALTGDIEKLFLYFN